MLDSISFWMEMIGVPLTFLDSFLFPKQGDKLEAAIDALGDRLFHLGRSHGQLWYQILLSAAIITGLLIGLGSFFSPMPSWAWAFFWITQIPTWSIIFIILLAEFIEWLNKISPQQRAITSLGVLLSLSGASIELILLIG